MLHGLVRWSFVLLLFFSFFFFSGFVKISYCYFFLFFFFFLLLSSVYVTELIKRRIEPRVDFLFMDFYESDNYRGVLVSALCWKLIKKKKKKKREKRNEKPQGTRSIFLLISKLFPRIFTSIVLSRYWKCPKHNIKRFAIGNVVSTIVNYDGLQTFEVLRFRAQLWRIRKILYFNLALILSMKKTIFSESFKFKFKSFFFCKFLFNYRTFIIVKEILFENNISLAMKFKSSINLQWRLFSHGITVA